MEDPISQSTAATVRSFSEEELREHVNVQFGEMRPLSTLPGCEAELCWDNPNEVILSHLWIDEKLRGWDIDGTIFEEISTQLESLSHKSEEDSWYITVAVQSSNGAVHEILRKNGFRIERTYEDSFFGEMVEGQKEVKL
jgi:hypothetical protein